MLVLGVFVDEDMERVQLLGLVIALAADSSGEGVLEAEIFDLESSPATKWRQRVAPGFSPGFLACKAD